MLCPLHRNALSPVQWRFRLKVQYNWLLENAPRVSLSKPILFAVARRRRRRGVDGARPCRGGGGARAVTHLIVICVAHRLRCR